MSEVTVEELGCGKARVGVGLKDDEYHFDCKPFKGCLKPVKIDRPPKKEKSPNIDGVIEFARKRLVLDEVENASEWLKLG